MTDQQTRAAKSGGARRPTNPLIHDANGFLISALKSAWHLTRFVAGVAIRIPGWFVRANRHLSKKQADQPEHRV